MPKPPLAKQILAGQRRALAKAITLIESSRSDHEAQAQTLLNDLAKSEPKPSIRIGLTGVPGVGKSTLIEAWGNWLTEQGHQVAVLAVDPSSARTGGSILGDKTRMPKLATNPQAFIRPSPSKGTLGGVTRRTRETMLLCEAAGFNVILVETVGVGQSETQVAAMTDLFVLLTLPNAGDELQGIKRGIMEMADLCVVNKADLNPAAATRAQTELRTALTLLTPHDAPWQPQALKVSALSGIGMATLWQKVTEYLEIVNIAQKRQQQTQLWFEELLREVAWQAFLKNTDMKHLQQLRADVLAGKSTPVQAVQCISSP